MGEWPPSIRIHCCRSGAAGRRKPPGLPAIPIACRRLRGIHQPKIPGSATRRRQKKTSAPEIALAQEAEIQGVIESFRAHGLPDGNHVAELEILLRTAIFKPLSALLETLLQQAVEQIELAYQPKAGERIKGRHRLVVAGIFGSFTLLRRYYHHAGKKIGHYPADAALGLEGACTPALARLICLEGADEMSFEKASRHLHEVGGIELEERQIQRVVNRIGPDAAKWQRRESAPGTTDARVLYVSADATGVPMRGEELVGRKGKADDGVAKTRMALLGCVFTQHKEDEEGHPMRDHESTTYLGGFESTSDFGIGLRREAIRRGLYTVPEVVLLVDGATGLEKMGRDYFADATQIVDLYHALEHLQEVAELLLGKSNAAKSNRRRAHWKKLLLADGVERIIHGARKEALKKGIITEVEAALGYFINNQKRMQYGTFRSKGYFIGSGVVEAGCRTVIGQRCKQSGMFWSEAGASSILALRSINASRYLQDYWKHRRNSHAEKNDLLPLAA